MHRFELCYKLFEIDKNQPHPFAFESKTVFRHYQGQQLVLHKLYIHSEHQDILLVSAVRLTRLISLGQQKPQELNVIEELIVTTGCCSGGLNHLFHSPVLTTTSLSSPTSNIVLVLIVKSVAQLAILAMINMMSIAVRSIILCIRN